VSVRSVEEAQAALAGGADLIDVKEPTRGPLGRADDEVINAVITAVGCRVPVSAALGEWSDRDPNQIPMGLTYAKWGLAGRDSPTPPWGLWIPGNLWLRARRYGTNAVVVAYADWPLARSPDPEVLANQTCQLDYKVFLLDTAAKNGATLLDWIKPAILARLRFQLADAGVRMAMAGSLDANAIRELAPLAPDWFAVRGAVCEGGRNGTVSEAKVRELKAVIAEVQTQTGEG
jgi:uncharacterized protein (UPF0264 family)